MSRTGASTGWAAALAVALLCGIVVAWSPRYWPVSVAICAISILALCWTVLPLFKHPFLILSGSTLDEWPGQIVIVALLGCWGFLQTVLGVTVQRDLTLENAIVWAYGAGVFVLATKFLRDRSSRTLFLDIFLWAVTALAVIAMLQFYNKPVRVFGIFPAIDGVTGTLLSRNQFAALMELGAPVALWNVRGRNRVGGGLCYAMILAATITSASRAGVVIVAAELFLFLVQLAFVRRSQPKMVLAISASVFLLVAVAAGIAGIDQIEARFKEKDPTAIRRELVQSTLKLIASKPWGGYGLGTWRTVYPSVATYDLALLANEAHNDWVQWAAEGGIPFFILMAVLVIWITPSAIQSTWGVGVLAVMVHSYFDYPTREPALMFLWFALAGAVAQFGAGKDLSEPPEAES